MEDELCFLEKKMGHLFLGKDQTKKALRPSLPWDAFSLFSWQSPSVACAPKNELEPIRTAAAVATEQRVNTICAGKDGRVCAVITVPLLSGLDGVFLNKKRKKDYLIFIHYFSSPGGESALVCNVSQKQEQILSFFHLNVSVCT